MAHFEQRSPAEVGDDSAAAGRSMCSVAALVSRGGVREAVAVEHAHLQARAQLQPGRGRAHRVAGILARWAPHTGGLFRRPRAPL